MNAKRIAMIGAAGALATWLAAAATSGIREPIAAPAAPTAHAGTRGAALDGEISRLHDSLRPGVTPRQPGRNLFKFAPRQAPAAPPPLVFPVKPSLSEVPVRPPAPPLKLSGIAENVTSAGTTRTAVISAFGDLFLVKEGEKVTDRYRVAKISSEVVELSDLTDGTVIRLALK